MKMNSLALISFATSYDVSFPHDFQNVNSSETISNHRSRMVWKKRMPLQQKTSRSHVYKVDPASTEIVSHHKLEICNFCTRIIDPTLVFIIGKLKEVL